VVFSISGHILVVARTRIRRMYYRGFYVIRLVDSVCAPSTCSFLRCSATCSAVGKEWSHFGHVKPVSDMTSDWTILNKKHASVCYSIAQVATRARLSSSLCILTRPDQIMPAAARQSGRWYWILRKKLWLAWVNVWLAVSGKTGCLRSAESCRHQCLLLPVQISTSAMIF
jgi:hypothetical protein